MSIFRGTFERLVRREHNTSVVIPAVNEAATIAHVLSLAKAGSRVGEIIVVDDGSIDDTVAVSQELGARVVYSTHLGKGASMADGLREAKLPYVVFLDADISGIRTDAVDRLVSPLETGQADMVKGRFSRSQGRVTELVAKPLLRLFFPELNSIRQPLSGQIAIKRDAGRSIRLENDYGVDIGLLIDASMAGLRIQEVDLGQLDHRHHDLPDLLGMAFQIAQTILQRAQFYGRIDGESLEVMRSVHRQMEAALDGFARLDASDRTLLLSLDEVLSPKRFIDIAAEHFGFARAATALLRDPDIGRVERAQCFARLLAGVSQEELAMVAGLVPLIDDAVDCVVKLRKLGYTVGVICDEFLVAAEVTRRRVFADFSLGHLLDYDRGHCSGNVRWAESYLHPSGCAEHELCRSNILLHLAERSLPRENIVVVGGTIDDACLLDRAGLGIAYRTKHDACRRNADAVFDDTGLGHIVDFLSSEVVV